MENQIKITDNGPLVVSGDVRLVDSDGNQSNKKGKYTYATWIIL